jgi:lysophospholipid acyltransferase (LPLAT)-like uncharacterized protein
MTEAAKQRTGMREDQHVQTGDDLRPLHLPLARRVQIPILAGAVYALAGVIGPTLRQEVLGWQHIERVHATGRRCIYSFWHRTIFLAMWKWRHQGVVAMTSANFDGQLLRRALEQFGYGTTHGSSSRGGLRGLAVLARRLQQGHDAAFAADGPRGPRYVAKAGPVLLARRTGCPIVGFHLFAERAHTFEKSWDRFQVPHLFSRVVLVVGAPIEVARKADRDTLDGKHAELQKLLERVRDTAEGWFKLSQAEQDRERAFWNQ